MPILLINKHSGQQIMVKGESVGDFLERQKGGRIPVEWPDGHLGDVMKDAVWATKVIPLDEHNKNVEAQKAAEEKQKADQEAAQQKAKDDQAKGLAEYEYKKAQNAAWGRKFFLARLFTRKPFPDVR